MSTLEKDTTKQEKPLTQATDTGQTATVCTKPFDPETARFNDTDDPCANGES